MDYKQDLNSDDDFDCSSNGYSESYGSNGQQRSSNPNGLSKAELRKTNKPIMEKRRRARINHCLNELKSLILEAMKKDPARHTKLEKADILEMTVKHLQSVQRQQLNMAIQTDPSVVHKFKTGFVECAEEVNRYIGQLEGIDSGVRQRLTNHLSNCANSLEQIGSMTNFNNGYRGQLNAAVAAAGLLPHMATLPQDLNNNSNSATGNAQALQMGGLQLIPSRLPSGEFALIMPNSNALSTAAAANALAPTHNATAAGFGWPTATSQVTAASGVVNATLGLANPSHLHDYANSFRMSAFSKPNLGNAAASQSQASNTPPLPPHSAEPAAYHSSASNNSSAALYQQHSRTATSPPLSPVSSLSSHGDDSIIMPGSVAHTPAETHSFAGVFSTPPPTSAETSFTSLNSSTSSQQSAGNSSCAIAATRPAAHLQQQQVSSTSGHEPNAATVAAATTAAKVDSATNASASLKRERSDASADSSDCSQDRCHAEPTAKKMLTATEKAAAWRPW